MGVATTAGGWVLTGSLDVAPIERAMAKRIARLQPGRIRQFMRRVGAFVRVDVNKYIQSGGTLGGMPGFRALSRKRQKGQVGPKNSLIALRGTKVRHSIKWYLREKGTAVRIGTFSPLAKTMHHGNSRTKARPFVFLRADTISRINDMAEDFLLRYDD